ncbi:ComEA family DNA-binding protein [Helicobacter burdigaliensis]|uniref:ComEA family DNA-binding protein n=1 Tax=Helicobacter burdigaliensis TaxID=2315334 RepID=UPI000EF73FE1|nr:helix-hairpin-helix domain-containing protein [Helicobacter burdigaliensis]
MRGIKILFLLSSFLFASFNFNTATKEELMSIKGIGEVKANAILEYREQREIKRVEDLLFIKGFGKKSVENIKEYLKTIEEKNMEE